MAQILSKAEIASIMADENGGSSYRARWPTIKDKELILEAIQAKAEVVALSGAEFSLRYTQGRTYPIGPDGAPVKTEVHSTVYVRPKNGFVPSGWFDEETLKKELLK